MFIKMNKLRMNKMNKLCYILVIYVCVLRHFSCVWLFVIPWTVAHQTPLSVGFFRQHYWSVAMPSSRGSSQPRDWTHVSYVSCIARFLTISTTWEWKSWNTATASISMHLKHNAEKKNQRFFFKKRIHSAWVHFSSVQFSHSVVSDSLRPHEP